MTLPRSDILRSAALAAPLLVLAGATAHAQDARSPLVGPQELAERLENGELRVVDIRGQAGGYIPGAVAAPYGQWRGPQDNPGQLPGLDALTELVQGLGIDAETPVVVTHAGSSATDFGAAARVYWKLKSLGVEDLAVLDGGVAAWQAAGLPLEAQPAEATPSDYTPAFDQTWLTPAEDVERLIETGEATLLDARPPSFFLGELWHAAARKPGTIPNADNLPHDVWFVDGGSFLRDADEIAAIAEDHGLDENTVTVSFCNTGHWAATNWFVLSEVAGLDGVTLYPESMVEWSQAGKPMANAPGRVEWLWRQTRDWFEGLLG